MRRAGLRSPAHVLKATALAGLWDAFTAGRRPVEEFARANGFRRPNTFEHHVHALIGLPPAVAVRSLSPEAVVTRLVSQVLGADAGV
jgi:hypothetical protein